MPVSLKKPRRMQQKTYADWIADLTRRYRKTQIKAAIAVNSALIEFYWNLGKDISERYPGRVRDAAFYAELSRDLRGELPDATGLSTSNLKYTRYFYELYRPQLVDDSDKGRNRPQPVDDKNLPQLVSELVCVPWGHHRTIIDKCRGNRRKALFYVHRTIQNGWSRNVLLNSLASNLYEAEGKAQTNFSLTLPSEDCELAQQLVKDPHVFEVMGLGGKYLEADLKTAIVGNIERTLLSLGKGVAFLGREYPVEIGGETKAIDLLFYVVPLHRYLVMEVKTGKYEPADLGQLSGYLVMAEQCLNTPGDNPPIGVLICKEHNRVLAKLHLAKLGLPLGISDYEIRRVLPTSAQLAKCYADAEAQVAKASD